MRKPVSEETKEKMRQARLGKKWSDEIKLKFRLAKLGKKQSEEHKAKYKDRIPWNKDKTSVFSEETKRLMREAKIGKAPPAHKPDCQCFRCNKKYPNYEWKETERLRTKLKDELKVWKRDVFVRDGFCCVMCHSVGRKLNAHHIKKFADYPDLRLDINNGVTLCVQCHKSVTNKEKEYEDLFVKLTRLR